MSRKMVARKVPKYIPMVESCCTLTHTPLNGVTMGFQLQLLSVREDMSLSATRTELEDWQD